MFEYLILAGVNLLLVLVNIIIHYETLYLLAKKLNALQITHRYRVLYGVLVIFRTHTIEIIIFGLGYYQVLALSGMGVMSGTASGDATLLDCIYFSFVTYTTVGYGDIFIHGLVRYMTGVEALLGLILITWSASFLYIEMQKNWTTRAKD